MTEKQIFWKLFRHVAFGMMPVVTLLCFLFIVISTVYILEDESFTWMWGVGASILFWTIIFIRMWRDEARVHYLINHVVPDHVYNQIEANFEMVCLEGHMKEYREGVLLSSMNTRHGVENKLRFSKDHSRSFQAGRLGQYLRSVTKWA